MHYRYDIFPQFYKGSIESAAEFSKNTSKLLLVYLHSYETKTSRYICDHILSNPDFVNYVTNNFIIWGCDSFEYEGIDAAVKLGIQSPFLGVYCHDYFVNTTSSNGSLIKLEQFHIISDNIIERLKMYVKKYKPIFKERAEEEERRRIKERELLKEQEEEYLRIVAIDQERERERQLKLIQQKEEEKRKEDMLREITKLKDSLPDEPIKGAGVATIAIQLMNGDRVVRNFNDNDTTEMLYNFVYSKELTFDIELLSSSHQKIIPKSSSISLKDAELTPKSFIYSQEKE